ncbi:DUF3301 domain-containing protein [Endozoicomonas ascidiicola]|uniref:DUF3301 domain-containing protein n=1 Tax=Endozoicomonas ascidiicola TaxID=1698521 RepID=UPI0008374097|nr:DUF3301 domain-containing protein [Endozoicomonas ascidiicola]
MDVLLWLTLLFLLLYYWFDTARAKEAAVVYGKKACHDMSVQFLDDSVVRYRTRFRRGYSGQMVFERFFKFEYTLNGQDRVQGFIQMLGKQLKQIDIDDPEIKQRSDNSQHSPRLFLHTEESHAVRSRAEERPDRIH